VERLTVIVAGDVDQPLHIDAVVPDGGDPVDAASHYSMLLALGAAPNYHMYLGVQRDELVVDRYDNTCTLASNSGIATPRQSFLVDRQNEHLFVLRLRKGAYFTGDFRHAGVQDMTQKELTAKLVRLVAPPSRTSIDDAAGEDSLLHTTFMSFHGLNNICRLHVVTRPLDTLTTLDEDKVGFDMCVPNKARGHSERRPDDPKSLHVDVSVRKIDRQTRTVFAFDKHFQTKHAFKGAVEKRSPPSTPSLSNTAATASSAP
jgi:hypothetical protein